MSAAGARDIAAMALRNLSRHKAKTAITAVAVAVSVSLYIFMDGWLLGMNLDSRRNIVSYEIGAAKVQAAAYFEKKDELPMHESFAGWKPLAESLERAGYAVAPRFVFSGTLYSRSGSAPLVIDAVDVGLEGRVLRYPSSLEAGRFPAPGRLELAIGSMAAEKLRVGIPSRPTPEELEELAGAARDAEEEAFVRGLYGPAPEDEAAAALEARKLALKPGASEAELARLWEILSASGRMDVRISTVIDQKAEDGSGRILHVNQLIDASVVGVINSPNPKTNGNVAFMPLDSLQDEAGLMLGGKVTELLVRRSGASDAELPGRDESAAAVREALGPALPPGLEVHGWLDYVDDYIAASRGDQVSTRIMILMLFVLSFIGIANTMLMAILERTKETGMLRALGMTDGQVVAAYMIEAACIGAMGSLAGIAIGCLINVPMVAHGLDYSAMAEQIGGDYGYRITALFRSAWNPPVIVLSGIVATALSAAAALLPSLRALRMPVTESLRFE
ncbi:MAG TPA: FtsX-like permease family protein [Spirochaetales bacterium]|nr:FtsX-like permease family protein [Spirochaetales bacterium]HRY56009.1 FtsX-like permease family protein [Spirochaetia bacterium]HRZ65986.1 FtsX-like permease family protein [Spirochaetia bacterium]